MVCGRDEGGEWYIREMGKGGECKRMNSEL